MISLFPFPFPFHLALLLFLLQQYYLPCISTPSMAAPHDPKLDSQAPQTLMSAGELDALFQVMDSMAGYTNWRVIHPHPCTDDLWPGLVCEQGEDGLLHVTRLDFGYKPNPTCTSNASIPMAITKLSSLRSLFIFECFSTVNTTIPTSLQKLAPTLQQLSLRANSALVGGIPHELTSLLSLELLSLSQNSLQGGIPADLWKLRNLQQLDLSDNLLHGIIPSELGELHSLVILDLSVNSFTGPIPASLGNLSMLQKVDLSFNSLQGPIPEELGGLGAIKFFAANNNLINGPLPLSMRNWAALQYLILDHNQMNVPIPGFIGALRSLMALSLSDSGYYGTIPAQLGLLGNLTVLSLEGNNLTGGIPMGLGQLPHIYQLNLSKNSLSGAVPFTEEFVKKLGRNLDLEGNEGLCSHWAYEEGANGGAASAGLGQCTDPKDAAYVSNGRAETGGSMERRAATAALRLCLLSLAAAMAS